MVLKISKEEPWDTLIPKILLGTREPCKLILQLFVLTLERLTPRATMTMTTAAKDDTDEDDNNAGGDNEADEMSDGEAGVEDDAAGGADDEAADDAGAADY